MNAFGLNNYSSVIIPGESKFMNHQNGDSEFQTNKRSLLQLASTTGLVVTGNGTSCNTWNISYSVCFRKYSIDGGWNTKQKDSNFDTYQISRKN